MTTSATTTERLPLFKTEYRLEKEARELKIYNEYRSLMSVKGQAVLTVIDYLKHKYGIHSASTIYSILKRVPARLSAEEGGER